MSQKQKKPSAPQGPGADDGAKADAGLMLAASKAKETLGEAEAVAQSAARGEKRYVEKMICCCRCPNCSVGPMEVILVEID